METTKICVNWQSSFFTVDKVGLEKIIEVMREYALCSKCHRRFSEEWPQVAGQHCLYCVTHQQHHQPYSYIGERLLSDKRRKEVKYTAHLFLNKATKYVHISQPGLGRSEEPQQDEIETLKYYGFNPPYMMRINGGEEVECYDYILNGKFSQQIILVTCRESYKHEHTAYFLCSKDGRTLQLNNRKRAHQELMKKAKERDRGFPYMALVELLNEHPELWPEEPAKQLL